MPNSEIISKVNAILEEDFEIESDALNENAHLYEELELDSLDAVDLVVAIEEKLNVKIPEEDMREIRTLGELYNFLESLQKS